MFCILFRLIECDNNGAEMQNVNKILFFCVDVATCTTLITCYEIIIILFKSTVLSINPVPACNRQAFMVIETNL
uniref:Uncharacterized protein n=1 Tax=Sphingobacterium sp. (strain 21) TaxID=743722 RepID=F4CCH8_SPHS2